MELELVEQAGLGLEEEGVEAPGGEEGVGEGVGRVEGRGLRAVQARRAPRQQALAQPREVQPLTL